MRSFYVWAAEALRLLTWQRLHPLKAQCPICYQMVRLHYRKAGRRHLMGHALAYSQALFEGSRFCAHYTTKIKCLGSDAFAKFDPRPDESQQFNLPKSINVGQR